VPVGTKSINVKAEIQDRTTAPSYDEGRAEPELWDSVMQHNRYRDTRRRLMAGFAKGGTANVPPRLNLYLVRCSYNGLLSTSAVSSKLAHDKPELEGRQYRNRKRSSGGEHKVNLAS